MVVMGLGGGTGRVGGGGRISRGHRVAVAVEDPHQEEGDQQSGHQPPDRAIQAHITPHRMRQQVEEADPQHQPPHSAHHQLQPRMRQPYQ